jgi:hypothetical protein
MRSATHIGCNRHARLENRQVSLFTLLRKESLVSWLVTASKLDIVSIVLNPCALA